jgi:predicted nucleic acid-binding protein
MPLTATGQSRAAGKILRVVLDACVLYPTVMREVLLGCAARGLFEPKWSARILEEWARATVKLGPEAEVFARGEVAVVMDRFPAAMVGVQPGLEQRLWLPDPDDVHVLAAAVAGSADAILTMNAQDFPRGVLDEEGLLRVDPDNFLVGLHERDPSAVEAVVTAVAAEATRLSGEDWTPRRLMKKARLNRFAKVLP